MVTIDLCGNLMFFPSSLLSLLLLWFRSRPWLSRTILRVHCHCGAHIKTNTNIYMHTIQSLPYAKFVVCKLWPRFVYFTPNFCQITRICIPFCFFFSFPLLALFYHIVVILMVIVVLVLAYADWQNVSFKIAIAVLMSGNACMWLEPERN